MSVAGRIVLVGRDAAGREVRIGFASVFEFADSSIAPRRLDPSEQALVELGVIGVLKGDRIESACVDDERGLLTIRFASGRRVSSDTSYGRSSWEISAPGFELIGGPGGGTVLWEGAGLAVDRAWRATEPENRPHPLLAGYERPAPADLSSVGQVSVYEVRNDRLAGPGVDRDEMFALFEPFTPGPHDCREELPGAGWRDIAATRSERGTTITFAAPVPGVVGGWALASFVAVKGGWRSGGQGPAPSSFGQLGGSERAD